MTYSNDAAAVAGKSSKAKNPALSVPRDAVAYIIFTSGSTGTPKVERPPLASEAHHHHHRLG
jgi:acyl-coenzyme A synthetase/AMP-(fatty) acid ligase